jgi:ribonuclease-3
LLHRFSDISLLRQALTHKSAINPDKTSWLLSNERLEFLGDAVLDCLVTEHLYKKYPDKSEGQLSKIKSLIVSRKILGDIGFSMDFGRCLYLGASEKKAGGQSRKSVLSNAFEALLGALYLDGGLDVARNFLQRYLFTNIEDFVNDKDNVNHKSKILEMAQRDGFGIPRYKIVATAGPDHAKEFTVRISIAGVTLGEGTATNKKQAEQLAAADAIVHYDTEHIRTNSKGEDDNELLSD